MNGSATVRSHVEFYSLKTVCTILSRRAVPLTGLSCLQATGTMAD